MFARRETLDDSFGNTLCLLPIDSAYQRQNSVRRDIETLVRANEIIPGQ